jgi:iron complex outermembrane receptor protein
VSRAHPFVCAIASQLAITLGLVSSTSLAQVVAAEPIAPIEASAPEGAPALEVQVTLQLVVDASGRVESAVVLSRAPVDAPPSFEAAAVDAAKRAEFRPSTRDARPIRSRVEYVVVFHAPPESNPPPPTGSPLEPAAPSVPAPPTRPLSTNEQDEDYAQVVIVRGTGWSSPRGLGDVRIKRELLEASPRQQTSEMLSAAPGFFVDHEDSEGLGNDVFLRGFDLEHGSGIEMRVGNVPINSPLHVQGQGYADANFIIPEVVRSIRVLEGPYDPRQGDAAIVGSAYFDLGVTERGYQLKTTYGSFNQARLVGIAAPEAADEETFAAFALRKTDGFGANRSAESGTINAQYAVDVGVRDRLRLLATAYGARATLPGVVRQDDVDSGRIGFYDSYPFYTAGQGVQSTRVILGADLDHVTPSGARFEFAPWLMWTDFRSRQNFSGNIYSSEIDPMLPGGLGDLWEMTNVEAAGGVTARFHSDVWRPRPWVEITGEPGVYLRTGHTDQTKSLINPVNPPNPVPGRALQPWDRRVEEGLNTLDVGAYVDLDLHLWRRLRLSGGLRADLLGVSIKDNLQNVVPAGLAPPGALPGAVRAVQGVAAGPRVTIEYEVAPGIAPVAAYGEGFRSLAASSNPAASAAAPASLQPNLQEGSTPYSKVRSVEAGFRARLLNERYTATLAAFETWVGNEVVFEATSGGLATESASIRRGIVASVVAKPWEWLLVSSAASVTTATFTTLVAGVSHFVPNIPPVLIRADVTARRKLAAIAGRPLTGRVGVGYTFLAGRHLTDTVIGPAYNVLNMNAALRYGGIELGLDAYNLFDLQYADDEEVFVSNWNVKPSTLLASTATHISAAAPRTLLGTLALYF